MRTAKFTFHFNWKLTLFSAVLFPCLLSLGFWQIDRAEQKQTILQDWQQQQAQPPISFHTYLQSNPTQTRFRRVWAEGHINTQKYWLIENKVVNGRIGAYVVAVLQPKTFEVETGVKPLLINLGWIELPARRDESPEINLTSTSLRFTGMLSKVNSSPLIDEAQNTHNQWPHKMLEIDVSEMEKQLGFELYDWVLKVDPDSPAAYHVNWQAVNMTSTQHIGYAVQWFSLAAALFVLWVLASSNLIEFVRSKRATVSS